MLRCPARISVARRPALAGGASVSERRSSRGGGPFGDVANARPRGLRRHRISSDTAIVCTHLLSQCYGALQGFLLPEGLRLQVVHQSLNADPAVVVDLSAMSRMHGLEVSGVIGFPAIRRSFVRIYYRNATVPCKDFCCPKACACRWCISL